MEQKNGVRCPHCVWEDRKDTVREMEKSQPQPHQRKFSIGHCLLTFGFCWLIFYIGAGPHTGYPGATLLGIPWELTVFALIAGLVVGEYSQDWTGD